MYWKNAEAVILELGKKGFLKHKGARKQMEAQEVLENLHLEYIEE